MRSSRVLVVITAGALASVQSGCFKAEFNRDGAGCSDRATCPPGQVCSVNGQCLFPCPIPDCVGASCGCAPHGDTHIESPNSGYVCLADGLCHLKCEQYMGCNNDLVCGANWLCLVRCNQGDQQDCPNDATCREDPTNNNNFYCQGGLLDGGVAGDAGICTECPSYGCVFLDRDPNHCGACDHACQVGDCEGGVCQARVVAFGPGLAGGTTMAYAGDNVYWTARVSQGVYACQRSNCSTLTLICVGAACGQPAALAVTPSAVYWIDEHDGDARILACPLAGCTEPPTVVLEGLGRATALATDGSLLYFSSSDGLQRCPEEDCASYAQVIHTADLSTDTVSLAVGVSEMVWTSFNDGAVRKCPKTGCVGAPDVLVEDPGSYPASVTTGDPYLAWVMYGRGEVQYCAVDDCTTVLESQGSFESGEPEGHLSTLAFLPDGVLVVDADHRLRYCAYDAGGAPCDTVGPTGVWTAQASAMHTALFGVEDGRILELGVP